MRVVIKPPYEAITLRDIEVGEAFLLDDIVYIKTDEYECENTNKHMCINTDGVLFRLSASEVVTRLKATLVVGEYNETE